MTRKDHWEHIYRAKGPTELSWYQADPRLSLELIHASGISKHAAILDVGGGASTLVDKLLEQGYDDLSVLDVSSGALEQAQHRLGDKSAQVSWLEADITRFKPPHPYALWHDRAVFHFLTEADDRTRYIETLKRRLLPAGQVIMATFALDGPEKCSGLPVRRYDAKRLKAELGPDFELLEERSEAHLTPNGTRRAFCYGRFQRNLP